MIRKTKKDKVKQHLLKGYSITQKDATDLYHTTRLAAIIFCLKEEGMDIEMKMESNGISKYGRYKLIPRDGKRNNFKTGHVFSYTGFDRNKLEEK